MIEITFPIILSWILVLEMGIIIGFFLTLWLIHKETIKIAHQETAGVGK